MNGLYHAQQYDEDKAGLFLKMDPIKVEWNLYPSYIRAALPS